MIALLKVAGGVSDSLQVALLAVISCLIWVLGTKLRSSGKVTNAFYH